MDIPSADVYMPESWVCIKRGEMYEEGLGKPEPNQVFP
jgi:hypothetical protein